MNRTLAIVIVAVVMVNVAVLAIGFSYLQGEINSLKPPQPTPTPTAALTNPANIPTVTPTSTSQETPSPSQSNVVYEWYLRSEYIGNETWLKSQMEPTTYNSGKPWADNYIAYIGGFWEIPQSVKDSQMGALAGAHYIFYVSTDVKFNQTTGLTTLTYEYKPSTYYTIESDLPYLATNENWTKEYV